MSRSTALYTLGLFGLSATQRMVLGSLCKLSQNRAVSYTLADSAAPRGVNIVLVDADDAAAVQSWKSSLVSGNGPVVFVSAKPLVDLESHQYNVIRSRLSGGLLQLLDRVSVSELRHRVPVVVSDDVGVRQPGDPRSAASRASLARALIIDDSLSVRTQMHLCLEKEGIAAEFAEDARQGLEKLQERYYDLVFLDVMLPDMDGYQVCKLIKRAPGTQRVPVIMLTSKGSTINRIQGSIAGCDRYLIKPATERDVIKVVRDFLPRVREKNVHLRPV